MLTEPNKKKRIIGLAFGVGMGAVFGVAIGAATGNIGVWIGISALIGVGVGFALSAQGPE